MWSSPKPWQFDRFSRKLGEKLGKKPKNCRKSPKVTPKIGRLPQIWRTPLHEGCTKVPQPGAPLCTPLHEGCTKVGGISAAPLATKFAILERETVPLFAIFASFVLFLLLVGSWCVFWLKRSCRVDSTALFKRQSAENPDQTGLAKGQRLRNRDGSTLVGLVFRAQAKINKMVEFRSLTRSSQDEEDSPSPQKSPDFPPPQIKQFWDTFLRLSLRFRISAASSSNCKSTSQWLPLSVEVPGGHSLLTERRYQTVVLCPFLKLKIHTLTKPHGMRASTAWQS